MGHVHVTAELAWQTTEEVRFLVDTGATYTVLPADLADRLGLVRSPAPVRVALADGTLRDFPFSTVLIAPAGTEPLLGVETLEVLGLRLDPASGTLEPTRTHAVLAVGALAAI